MAALAVFALCWRWMDALGDTFWYVAVGRLVVNQGALPVQDPFTYTATDAPWTLLMPGSYVSFALTERYLGLTALLFSCALIEAAAWVLVWMQARSSVARWALLPLVLVGPWLQRDDLAARGQVFGDLGLAILLVLLLRCLKMGSARRPLFAAWALPLGAVWTNLHPSELLGLLLPPAFALGLFIEQRTIDTRIRAMVVLWAGFLLGCLVNPYGAALPIEHADLALRASTRNIDLFRPPDFGRVDVWLVFGAAAGAFLWVLKNRRTRGAEALVLFCLVVAAASGRRYLPLLLLTTIAFLGHECRLRVVVPRRFGRAGEAIRAVVLGALLLWGASTAKDPLQHVPAASVRFIDEHRLPGRYFNPYHFGGYLDYAWGPRGRVFIDGRNQLFDAGVTLEAHDHITLALPGWERLLAIYGVRTALVERGSPLSQVLAHHPGWERRFSEPFAEVFVRRTRDARVAPAPK